MTTQASAKRSPRDDEDIYGVSIRKLGRVMQAERKLAGFKTTEELSEALFKVTGVEKKGTAIRQYESGRAECTFSYLVAFCVTCCASKGGTKWLNLLNNITMRSLGDGLQEAIESDSYKRLVLEKAFEAMSSPGYQGAYTEVLGRDADGNEIVVTTKAKPRQ